MSKRGTFSLLPAAGCDSASRVEFQYHRGAIHIPSIGLWLDAHKPIGPKEAVFVSHAHSDHIAGHAEVFLTPATRDLMRARLPGQRIEHVIEFGRRVDLSDAAFAVRREAHLTLLPAGHVLGSAMSLVETAAGSLLYTGDFKLQAGRSAEVCEPRQADTLIMETTFARPKYVFPPLAEVAANVVAFCQEALAGGNVPVLLAYSLGKSQEIMPSLAEAGLKVMVSPPTAKMSRIYARFGQQLGAWEEWDVDQAQGRVVIAPPGAKLNALKTALGGRIRTAVLTGWAIDSGCRFRYQADAAFPLSDHADFPDLLEFVKRVAPKRVFTLHGYASEFATTLRQQGIEAWALGEENQLTLKL